MTGLRAIVLEDDVLIAEDLAQMLRDLGHHVCGIAYKVSELAPLLASHDAQLVTVDVDLGDRSDGISAAAVIEAGGVMPIVFVTGGASPSQLSDMRSIRGASMLLKPFTVGQLDAAIGRAVRRTGADETPSLGD